MEKKKMLLYKAWGQDSLAGAFEKKYLVLGYYDYMELQEVGPWHQFRPQSLVKNCMNEEKYIMRLIREEQAAGGEQKAAEAKLICACCFICLKDSYLQTICKDSQSRWDDYVDKCKKLVENALQKGVKDISELEYDLYFCLGYSDIAVLLRSNSLDCIGQGVLALRSDETGCADGCVSTTYTIVALDTNVNAYKNNEQVRFMIDYSLESVAAKKSFCEANAPHNFLTGYFDWRAEANISINEFLIAEKEFLISWPGVRNVETKVMFNGGCDSSRRNKLADVSRKKVGSVNTDLKQAFGDFCAQYENAAKGPYYLHRRALGAVQEIVAMYNKISMTLHSFEVKQTVGPVLISFLTVMSTLMKSQLTARGGRDKNFSDGKAFSDFIEDSIKEFRCLVNPLLFDIWRSDHAFFEGQTVEHPSVGSTAKLLFAYNSALINWDATWQRIAQTAKEKEAPIPYKYLVSSGGRDTTINLDLFNGLIDGSDGEARPVFVLIPEASLYDVQGTLFRLLHEFFHKSGYHLREERAQSMYTGICRAFADYIVTSVPIKLLYVAAEQIYINLRSAGLSGESSFEVWREKCAYNKRMRRNRSKEEKKLDEQYIEISEAFQVENLKVGICLYLENLWCNSGEKFKKVWSENLYEKCVNLLSKQLEGDTGKRAIEMIVEAVLKESIKAAKALAEKGGFSRIYELTFNEDNCEYLKEAFGQAFEGWFWSFFDADGFNDRETYLLSWVKKKNKVINMGETIGTLYKECFADILALRALGVENFVQYVAAVLFENRSIKEYFGTESEDKKDSNFRAIRFLTVWQAYSEYRNTEGKSVEGFDADYEQKMENYYSQVFYPFSGDIDKVTKAKEYGKSFDETVKSMRKKYDLYKDEPQLVELRTFLQKAIQKNDELCKKICEQMKTDGLGSSESEKNIFVAKGEYVYDEDVNKRYLMNRWLGLYVADESSH